MRFREQIAARAGLALGSFHLLRAAPPARDVSLFGAACRTILGTCTCAGGSGACVGFFLDLRPVQEGIRLACAPECRLQLSSFLSVLRADAPPGWRPRIQWDGPAEQGSLLLHPGAVVVVDYEPALDEDAAVEATLAIRPTGATGHGPVTDADAHMPDDPHEVGGGAGHVGFSGSPALATGHSSTEPGQPSVPGGAPSDFGLDGAWQGSTESRGPATAGDARREAEASDSSDGLFFQVFSPEYDSELITTDLQAPTTASVVKAHVAQLRGAEAHRRSPRLVPSQPQPAGAPGVLLALPHWPFAGVAVLFDCRLVDGRIFALDVPGVMSRQDVLVVAGIDPTSAFHVFHGDLPWPVPEGTVVHPNEADLFVVCPVSDTLGHQHTFTQLLRGDVPCGSPMSLLAPLGVNWTLSDGVERAVAIPEDSFATDNVQAAEALQLTPGHFLLVPAVPPIGDHARKGRPSCRVMIACQLHDFPGGDEEKVPFVLDLRPILLEIGWSYATDGLIDMAALCARFRTRCPAGYHIRVYGGFFAGDEGNHFRRVRPGDVLVVEYHPNFVREVVSSLQPDSYAAPDDRGDGYGSSDNAHRSPAASTGSSQADAGTGGSHRRDTGRHTRMTLSGCCKCRWALTMQQALAEGRPICTSATSGLGEFPDLARSFCRLQQCWPAFVSVTHRWTLAFIRIAVIFAATLGVCIVRQLLLVPLSRHRPILIFLVLLQVATAVDGVQLSAGGGAVPLHADSDGVYDRQPVYKDLHTSRPVPTPVRAPPRLVDVGRLSTQGDGPGAPDLSSCATLSSPRASQDITLCTLLEDSRIQSRDHPLYLAATLIETLVEHFGHSITAATPTRAGSDKLASSVISLHDALPFEEVPIPPVTPAPLPVQGLFDGHRAPHSPLFLGGVALGFTGEQVSLFLQPAVRFGTTTDLFGLMSRARACALRALLPRSNEAADIRCFVDGSYTPSTPLVRARLGWACVFLDPALICVSIVSGDAPPWFDAAITAPSAFVAECFALTAAVWVGSTAFWGRHVTYLSDCQAALQVALGAVVTEDHPAALVLRRATACFTAMFGRPLPFCYVPGHQGVFGNEVADVSAKLAAAGSSVGSLLWCETGGAAPLDWWAGGAPRVEWCGLAVRCILGDPTLPPIGEASGEPRSHLDMGPEQLLAPFCPKQLSDPEGEVMRTACLHLSIATYNVLSLSGHAFADREPLGLAFAAGRPAMLASCLSAAQVQVAALQETRTEAGFLQRTEGYLRFASGGEAGCLGVELWFQDGFSLLRNGKAGCSEATFCKEAFSTSHKDSRRLLLHYHSGPLRLCFASLHAPHRSTEAAKLTAWWEETLLIFRQAAKRAPIVIGGDFNASVGTLCCDRIGDVSPEDQDDPGAFLKELLSICHCWLPSTWEHCHSGQSWTYIQKRNKMHTRPDFVCLPDCWANAAVSSWVDPEIHVGQPYIDHLAAVATVRATLQVSGGRSLASPGRIDVSALVEATSGPKLQAILDGAPTIPWQARPPFVPGLRAMLMSSLLRFPLHGPYRRLCKGRDKVKRCAL